MTVATQRRLAIAAALVAAAFFAGANAHLIARAFGSQPACVVVESAGAPAMRAC